MLAEEMHSLGPRHVAVRLARLLEERGDERARTPVVRVVVELEDLREDVHRDRGVLVRCFSPRSRRRCGRA